MSTSDQSAPEFALYHPWPPLDGRTLGEWVKSMLLFFEGVAVLAPPDEGQWLVRREEETLAPLTERGLFRVLDPGDLIQKQEAENILEFLFSMTSSLEYDYEYGDEGRIPHYALNRAAVRGGVIYPARSLISNHVSQSVMDTAAMLWEALWQHGVATKPDARGIIEMHPTFWAVYQAFIAHSVYEAGLRAGLVLRPATDSAAQVDTQNAMLDIPGHPSSGHVVDFDLQQVTLDLSRFELSEVLQFREEHGVEYRRYTRDLREFAMAVSRAKGDERRNLMQDRHDALADAADDLRRTSREWWCRAAASVGVGISGAVWSAARGEWPAAIIAVLGGAVGMGAKPKLDNAFSYLFRAEKSFVR